MCACMSVCVFECVYMGVCCGNVCCGNVCCGRECVLWEGVCIRGCLCVVVCMCVVVHECVAVGMDVSVAVCGCTPLWMSV